MPKLTKHRGASLLLVMTAEQEAKLTAEIQRLVEGGYSVRWATAEAERRLLRGEL